MFPRYLWVPPVICGLLAAGCAAGAAWNARAFAEFQKSFDSHHNKHGSSQEETKQDSADSGTAHDAGGAAKDSNLERIAEIMRTSTESTIQMLSDIFKD